MTTLTVFIDRFVDFDGDNITEFTALNESGEVIFSSDSSESDVDFARAFGLSVHAVQEELFEVPLAEENRWSGQTSVWREVFKLQLP